MEKILLGLLLLANTSYCQFFPEKASSSDSGKVVSSIQKNWQYTTYYYMPVSTNERIIKPQFIISDKLIITPDNDTFVNFQYEIEKVINSGYLYEQYSLIKYDTSCTAFVINLYTKTLPISIQRKCKNPNYTLQCEFLLYKDIIYYDKNGIVYTFMKN